MGESGLDQIERKTSQMFSSRRMRCWCFPHKQLFVNNEIKADRNCCSPYTLLNHRQEQRTRSAGSTLITDTDRKKNLQPVTVRDTIGLKATPLPQRVTEMCWSHREAENLLTSVLGSAWFWSSRATNHCFALRHILLREHRHQTRLNVSQPWL